MPTGRPKTAPEIISQVAELAAAGQSRRQIAAALDGRVPQGTINNIVTQLRRPQLSSGERALKRPARCEQRGHLVVIWPCRICRAMDTVAKLRQLVKRGAEIRAALAEPSTELKLALSPAQQRRLEAVRNPRTTRPRRHA